MLLFGLPTTMMTELSAAIERNRALAKELGITGTPGVVIGTEFYPGALELAALKELVARAQTVKARSADH